MLNQQTIKATVKRLFITKTPVFLVTYFNERYAGYIHSKPNDKTFILLDRFEKEPMELSYLNIKKIREFIGSTESLPKPNYMKELNKSCVGESG